MFTDNPHHGHHAHGMMRGGEFHRHHHHHHESARFGEERGCALFEERDARYNHPRADDDRPGREWQDDWAPPFMREGEDMSEKSRQDQLFELFHRVVHGFVRGHHHHHKPGGLHPGQGRILAILAEKDRMTQRELMDMLQVRSASLSELLQKLDRHGFIIREKDETDRRNVILSLSDRGRDAIDEHRQARQERVESLFSALSEDEQGALADLLAKLLADWLQNEDMPPHPHDGPPHHRRHGHPHHPPHHHRHGGPRGDGRRHPDRHGPHFDEGEDPRGGERDRDHDGGDKE